MLRLMLCLGMTTAPVLPSLDITRCQWDDRYEDARMRMEVSQETARMARDTNRKQETV